MTTTTEMNKEMEIRMKKIENKMSIEQKVFEFKLQQINYNK